jgi:dolichol-phosphate mannosyltransferase
MSTWVCISAKDEVETIGPLVRALAGRYQVLVVDAGSGDGTGGVALAAGATLISAQADGIGPCLMLAWRAALEHGATRIVQMDAGGSHDPADLPRLLAVEAAVVIGSRFVDGGSYQGRPWRAAASRVLARALSVSQPGWPRHIYDWTSGYRIFTRQAGRRLLSYRYLAKMHAWQIEVLARARQEHLLIEESPIHYRAGRSSFDGGALREVGLVWLAMMNHMQVYE